MKRDISFLEYLENQNAILAEYIKDGATVTFGNKSFGPKGEFIEEVLPEFGKSANLLSRSVGDFQAAQGIIVPGSSNNIISFKAFYRISISGIGKEMSHWTVFLIEPYKDYVESYQEQVLSLQPLMYKQHHQTLLLIGIGKVNV